MKEELQRFRELADRSFQKGQFTFTDFLSMAELSVFYENENELAYAHPEVYGGCEAAERKMIRFGNAEELGYEQEFPIKVLKIRPQNRKFADDLGHRDFLGALMNLGIRREMLGDIFVKENEAFLFCRDSIAEFIEENLSKVRHTNVRVEETVPEDEMIAPTPEDEVIQVSSCRIDACISRVYHLSRQDAVELFPTGLVFLNGRCCTENAKTLKPGDLVAVRGYGRFEFAEELGISKKGKLNCRVRVYR